MANWGPADSVIQRNGNCVVWTMSWENAREFGYFLIDEHPKDGVSDEGRALVAVAAEAAGFRPTRTDSRDGGT